MLSPQSIAVLFVALANLSGVVAQGRTTPLLRDFSGQPPLPSIAAITSNNASGTFLPLANIQGDILVGMKKPAEHFYFFRITNATAFKKAMRKNVIPLITSAQTLVSPPPKQPSAFVNMAFSQSGLLALGITDNLGDSAFSNGQFADAANLQDSTSTWETVFKGTSIHGVALVGSDVDTNIGRTFAPVIEAFKNCATIVYILNGRVRPGNQEGHEHFGYMDGISQPAIEGFSTSALPGQSMIQAGIILTGRDGDSTTRPDWALDGSFLAFRKLKQLVPEFSKFLLDNSPVATTASAAVKQQGADLLGARMIGRWKSGAPVDLSPTQDDAALGADAQRNNYFDFSHTGFDLASDQTHCPFSAHIRKTRPRADLGNGNTFNQAIRAGIPYGPEVTTAEASLGKTTTDRGLAFVMYQSNIGSGFQFQQSGWANNVGFIFGKTATPGGPSIQPGFDPIIGQSSGAARTFMGTDPRNATSTLTQTQTVISNGGEYFFAPSISALFDKFSSA